MWLFKSKKNLDGSHFGINFVKGYGFVEKYIDYRFFSENDEFVDITPDHLKKIRKPLKKVLVRVPGGIGDSIFTLPIVSGIKKMYPDCVIEYYGQKYGLEAIQNDHNIDKFHVYPKMFFDKYYDEYDDIFDLGNSIENNPLADFENAYEICCDMFDIKPDSYNPIIYVKEEETKHAKKLIADIGVDLHSVKIGVHLDSTSPIRNFPKYRIKELLDKLATFGHVFVFSTNSCNLDRENYKCPKCGNEDTVIVSPPTTSVTFECKCKEQITVTKTEKNPKVHHVIGTPMLTTVALINEMSVMLCVDSGLLHISAALEKPIVAMFSAFDGALRTKYFKNCITYQTSYRCAPCQLNNVPACPPMMRDGLKEPPCYNEYKVDDIVGKVKFILDKNGRDFGNIVTNPAPQVRFERNECLVCGHGNYDILGRKHDVAFAWCLNCESIFCLSSIDPKMYSDPEYHIVFNNPRLEKENFELGRNIIKRYEEMYGVRPGRRALDIGCSIGTLMKGIKDAGWAPYGIEYSDNAISQIDESMKPNVLQGDFITIRENQTRWEWNWPGRSNLKEIEKEDGTKQKIMRLGQFEVVVAQHTWEHMQDPTKSFKYMMDFVSDDGVLVIVGPAASTIGKLGAMKNIHVGTLFPGEHQFLPSKKAVKLLCDTFGYELMEYSENKVNNQMCAMIRKGKHEKCC